MWRHRTPVRPVVGAAVLVLTTEVFVHVFGEGNVLMSGVLLILVMLFMPEGLVGRCTIHGGSHSQAQFIANWHVFARHPKPHARPQPLAPPTTP